MDAITIGRFKIQTGLKSLKRDRKEEQSLKETQELNAATLKRIRALQVVVDKATVDGEHKWFLCLTEKRDDDK